LAHRYRGNLHPILGVIKAFCDRKLVNSVLYNWTDLITFFLNLFIQFFTSFVTANYMELYDREWSEQVYTFERFIEAYEEYFKENR
jgi:predicted PurR-regulated permease PerM